MKLETQDIVLQEFKKVFRGYDPVEVKAFLEVIAEKYKQAVTDQQKLQRALQDLKQSHTAACEALQASEQEIAKLRIELQKIDRLVDARIDAELILQKARSDAETLTGEALEQARKLKEEIDYLETQKQRSADSLRAYLVNQLSVLNILSPGENTGGNPSPELKITGNVPETDTRKTAKNVTTAEPLVTTPDKEKIGEHIGCYLDRSAFDELPEDINTAIAESDEEGNGEPEEITEPVSDDRRKKMVEELGQLNQQATSMFRKADFEKMLGEAALKKSEEIINQIYSELEKKKSKDQSHTETP